MAHGGSKYKSTMKTMFERNTTISIISYGALLVLSALTPTTVPGAQNAPGLSVVAANLNNPRGLAFGLGGRLYVAEAGLGAGDGHGGFGDGVGFTGSITEIKNLGSPQPQARRIVTGLASLGTTERGPEVVGPDGLAAQRNGPLYVIMAESVAGVLAGTPALDPDNVGQFGHLLQVNLEGRRTGWSAVADVGSFNYGWTGAHQNDPWAPHNAPPAGTQPPGTPQFPDANPYGVAVVGDRQYVTDAGANTLNEVRPDGTVRIVAYLPDPRLPVGGGVTVPVSDAVPTCVAQGPDGFLYVGTLAFGANFARAGNPAWKDLPKQSKIYRVDPKSTKFFLTDDDVWAAELNPVTGIAFTRNALYAVEIQTQESSYQTGDVVRIAVGADGKAGERTVLGAGQLHEPNGIAIDREGAVYVSNYSTSSGNGAVVRITQ
jgi:hypothetical protein